MPLPYLRFIAITILFACNNSDGSKENQSTKKESPIIGCYVPQTSDKDWYSSGKKAPKLDGLEGIDFKISTSSKEAQEYFAQGMMLAYGFNHAEAARSFYEAIRLDSTCAMAYWGFAYVLGPNYNAGMEEDNFQRAYEASAKATLLAKNGTPKEVALIQALTTRYASTPPADRRPLDSAYAASMKKIYTRYPTDPDIGALYAEAMMDLHPWDLYDKKTKAPRQWTPQLLTILEHLMKINPRHPGAHHFYVHALEASATPEKALTSAKLLETLVPGSGHLVHMPSHIYINTGDYHRGSLANVQALIVDSTYTTACHAQGAYPLAYYPHNYHFLAATATLEGHSKLAWEAAMNLQRHTAADIMRMPGWGTLQHYYTIPYYIAAKFSMWDTIASLTPPENDLVYPRAIWHYARGMAYLGKNGLANAQKELDSLRILSTDTTLQQLSIWGINTTADLVQIATKVLSAGIAFKQGQSAKSVSLLEEAVAIEDKLNYNEPPDWFFSVRHHLGAVLLKTGKYAEAEKVYKQDLQTWRKNGWALIGLYNSLALLNRKSEAQKAKSSFEESWKYADLKILSSSSIVD
ncbi:tetratricopeptide repeat protein [Chitinophaga sp. MM2321]|uniref:tetratricopeptide repeat protein n=1 Tax=Chitinophaga sp. MM2321 TaxID=3137178 RepID=UPI0032D5941C